MLINGRREEECESFSDESLTGDLNNGIADSLEDLGQDEIEKLKFALSLFKGTHSFHNFTLGRNSLEKGVSRYIKFFEIRDSPFVHSKQKWLALRVHGQSFMLHQIRKMIGLAVLCVKFNLTNDAITNVFELCFAKENRFNIPKMPGEGLFLERAVFDGYNKKAEKFDSSTIIWNEFELERCKQELIYPDIFGSIKTNCFTKWLDGIINHAYEMTFLSHFISIK